MKLPDELFYIPNRDKTFTEKWYPGRNLLNFPASFRAVLFGPLGVFFKISNR